MSEVDKTAMGGSKHRLQDFNNLGKHLGISLYQVRYSPEPGPFLRYLDKCFCARRLALLLRELASQVDACVLNLAEQDYDPHGASATALVAEARLGSNDASSRLPMRGDDLASRACVAHLDKSHIAIHTYPDGHPDSGIRTLRLDLDLGTCGERSPLHALGPLLDWVDCDLLTLDYRVRGFTRDRQGRKLFDEGMLPSVGDFLPESRFAAFEIRERRLPEENLLLLRMRTRHTDPFRHLMTAPSVDMGKGGSTRAETLVRREIDELFNGRQQSEKRQSTAPSND